MRKCLSFLLLMCFTALTFAQIDVSLDINAGISQGNIGIVHTAFDIGNYTDLFDDNDNTLARTPSINPMVITLDFANPIHLKSCRILMTYGDGTATLEAANSLTELNNQNGSYVVVFANEALPNGTPLDISFPVTTKKIFRLTAHKVTGDDYVHLNEWQLTAEAQVDELHFAENPETILEGFSKTLEVTGTDNTMNLSFPMQNQWMEWSSSDENIATVTEGGLLTGITQGNCTVEAVYEQTDATLNVQVTPDANAPDIGICYIKRLPEIDYVEYSSDPAADGWPEIGQTIQWRAYVKNWSSNTLENVAYKWELDGVIIQTGNIPMILPYTKVFAELDYEWSFDRHELTFTIDSDEAVAEVNEVNNSLSIFTDAISLNFYVEQSVYDYFRAHQSELNVGTNSWEDWAQQLHVARWNQMFANAINPETPEGVSDRIRLDSIIVVPDGALPLNGGLPGNNPNTLDKTVDLQWGFPATLLDGGFYANTTTTDDSNPFFFEGSLLHELGHARYLIDNYGFDVSYGPEGGPYNIDIMEDGVPVAGSEYMPFIAWDVVHYNNFPGLMSGDYATVDLYPAMCLNLIAGHRAVCGNMNAPCNIGIFMNDLPQENRITLREQDGDILDNATVRIFRAEGNGSTWYGKYYDNIADLEFTSDDNGQILVGQCPFSADGNIQHTFGISNGVVIVRVERGSQICYGFLESTLFNIQYWLGNTAMGEYELDCHCVPALPVTLVDLNAMVKENSVLLTWQTASETNNAGFEVQRRKEGTLLFEKTGWINGQGDSQETLNYAWEDATVEKGITYYYRLMQVDFDGNQTFSKIVYAQIGDVDQITFDLLPNPAKDLITIQIAGAGHENVELEVVDINGKIVYRSSALLRETTKIDLGFLPSGLYFVRLKGRSGSQTRRLMLE